MALLDYRESYSPFEYDWAYKYWELQQQSHWIHTEINMASDINDWKMNLTDTEKNLVGNILKGFTQLELPIQNYWSSMVHKWFPKSEIALMASAFAGIEGVHIVSYSYLNQSLGLEDFEAFLHEPTIKSKLDRLSEIKTESKSDIAKSLAIFSAFNEGVNLFSSFAILLSFSRRGLLKGVGQIISFSSKDESLHSEGGCQIFKTLISEYPEIWNDELKKDIYDAARITVELEDAFIDQAFSFGNVEGISAKEMKNFIRHRANTKLEDLGLKKNWKNISKESLDQMAWFDILSSGERHDDFFAARIDSYAKGVQDWNTIWE